MKKLNTEKIVALMVRYRGICADRPPHLGYGFYRTIGYSRFEAFMLVRSGPVALIRHALYAIALAGAFYAGWIAHGGL